MELGQLGQHSVGSSTQQLKVRCFQRAHSLPSTASLCSPAPTGRRPRQEAGQAASGCGRHRRQQHSGQPDQGATAHPDCAGGRVLRAAAGEPAMLCCWRLQGVPWGLQPCAPSLLCIGTSSPVV